MNPLRRTRALSWALGISILTAASVAVSEEATTDGISVAVSEEPTTDSSKETEGDNGEYVWAPVPLLQPSLGGGVVLVGLRFHPHEADAPTNITGAAVGYTSTDSYITAIGHDRHFGENYRWRFMGGMGYAKLNLNFNGIGAETGGDGESLSYSVEGTFVEPRLMRKFSQGWSVGVNAQFLDAEVSFDNAQPGDPLLEGVTKEELELTSYGLGLIVEKDTRDNRFSANTGKYFEATTSLFPGGLSNDLDYRIYTGVYGQYWQVRDSTVLAANINSTYADGEVPFYRLSKLNFRGVSGDTYWDKFLLQSQVEVRQHVMGNWSAAVFAGYGGVSTSLKKLNSDDMIVAGGAGIRYLVSAKQRLGLRLDVAKGEDEVYVYISIGEAF